MRALDQSVDGLAFRERHPLRLVNDVEDFLRFRRGREAHLPQCVLHLRCLAGREKRNDSRLVATRLRYD